MTDSEQPNKETTMMTTTQISDAAGQIEALEAHELATWLALRWPCTIGGAGFARDGEWYEDGRDAVRGRRG